MPAVELPVVFNAEYIGVHRSLGPSFSSPVIRSIIFQVLHFPAIEKFWFVIFWSCKFSAPSWWRRKNRQVKPKLKESQVAERNAVCCRTCGRRCKRRNHLHRRSLARPLLRHWPTRSTPRTTTNQTARESERSWIGPRHRRAANQFRTFCSGRHSLIALLR